MLIEMSCLILGVPVGYILRKNVLIIKGTDLALTWSVRLLLLLLGLALGADYELMSRMDSLGLRGAAISLCCVAGSLIGAKMLGPFLERATSMRQKSDTHIPGTTLNKKENQ